ncbi:MAG: helix-turn-helix transcriptional regulator [Clostridia bacterium]|nr:helix-turn-helix transcriptional regulator [Clostridia bacterium]
METRMELHDFYHVTLVHMRGCQKQSAWNGMPHAHDHYELSVHIRGALQIFAEENSYLLSGGEIRLYGAGELHCGIVRDEEEMEWYQINIPTAFCSYPDGEALTRIFRERRFGTGNVIRLKRQEEVVSMLKTAFDLYRERSLFAACYAKSALLAILCLVGTDDERLPYAAEKRSPALERILEIIRTEYAGLYTVGDLASRTHFSVSYINKLFRTQVGVSPYQFLLEKKLVEAKRHLRDGVSVTESARLVGFRDYSGFITLFRRRFGVTPHQYKGGG